jgi:hypothetical protein
MNQTSRSDPAIQQAQRRIQQEEDRLCDLEDQLTLADPLDATDLQDSIAGQREHLAGLYSGMNRMMAKRGM